jgi:transcriptional regulator with XRE-family HTH domain
VVLREVLGSRRIKHKQFARMVGVSPNTVSSWCTGAHLPGHAHSERIAAVLEMTLDELHGRVKPSTDEVPAVEPSTRVPHVDEQDARRIVGQLASLEVDEPLAALQRTTPQLLQILAEARAHVARGSGEPSRKTGSRESG